MSAMHYLMLTCRVPKLERGAFGVLRTKVVRGGGGRAWLSEVSGPSSSTVVELMREYACDGCSAAKLVGYECTAV